MSKKDEKPRKKKWKPTLYNKVGTISGKWKGYGDGPLSGGR